MAYENLKAAIRQAIKQNNNQEITGALLQTTLLSIVENFENNKAEKSDVTTELAKKFDKVNIAQETGDAADKVISQKVVTDIINDKLSKSEGGEVNKPIVITNKNSDYKITLSDDGTISISNKKIGGVNLCKIRPEITNIIFECSSLQLEHLTHITDMSGEAVYDYGNFNAKKYALSGGTAKQVLLGDGSTTSSLLKQIDIFKSSGAYTIRVLDINGDSVSIPLPGATKELAGLMTAADKIILDEFMPILKVLSLIGSTSISIGTGNDIKDENAAQSLAIGNGNIIGNSCCLANGIGNEASGNNSHAEGDRCTASGKNSHAEGNRCTASNSASHAEGFICIASGEYSHAEGYRCTAESSNSHAGGSNTAIESSGTGSFAHGTGLHVKSANTFCIGTYNFYEFNEDVEVSFIIGIGASNTSRQNALVMLADGSIFINGVGGYEGLNIPDNAESLQDILYYDYLDMLDLLSNTAIYVAGGLELAESGIDNTTVIDNPDRIIYDGSVLGGRFLARKDMTCYTHWKADISKNIAPPSRYGIETDGGVFPFNNQTYKFSTNNNVYIANCSNGTCTMKKLTLRIQNE